MFFSRAFFVLLVPAVELFAFLRVADAFGGAVAVLALFGLSFVGYVLVRMTGGLALRSVATSFSQGSTPSTRDLTDQAIRFIASLFIVIPGFVTAAIGALLFLPPVRALVRPLIETRAQSIIRSFPKSRRLVVDVDVVDADVVNTGSIEIGPASTGSTDNSGAPGSTTSTSTEAQQ